MIWIEPIKYSRGIDSSLSIQITLNETFKFYLHFNKITGKILILLEALFIHGIYDCFYLSLFNNLSNRIFGTLVLFAILQCDIFRIVIFWSWFFKAS